MGLFERLTREINEGQKVVKEGDYVELEILNRTDRYFIRNPEIIQDGNEIYVTNGNGRFYNLRYCVEIFVVIRTPREWVSINQYKRMNK